MTWENGTFTDIFFGQFYFKRTRWRDSLGLSGGDDMGISLGSMKDRKEEDEDEEVFLKVGLLTG